MAAAIEVLDDTPDQRTRPARQIALEATLLGVLADNVLRRASDGLGWSIWVAALAIATVLVVRQRRERMRPEQVLWLVLAVASASNVAWRAAEELQAWSVFATLIALAMYSMASVGRPASSIFSAHVRDIPMAWLLAAKDGLFGTPGLLKDAEIGSAIRSSAAARRPALRAVVITVPLVIVFTALLSRADPVFNSIFRLPDFEVGELAGHLMLGGVFAWLSAGWMRGTFAPAASRPDWRLSVPLKLGVVEITSALGAVAGLFAVFVAIQLRWLFGGAEVVQATTGLSVAEYARRGFFELVAVSALVFPLILGTRATIDDEAALRRHTRLSAVLLLLLAAIMASALLRMQLYVQYFGLTTDRLYAVAFMTWLAVVFAGLGLTVLRHWQRPFAAIAMLSAYVGLFALAMANPEAIVARVNLSRASTAEVDYEYLARLSGDAAPLVVSALSSAQPSAGACEAATRLRAKALTRAGRTATNLGMARGFEATLRTLTPSQLQRLCAK